MLKKIRSLCLKYTNELCMEILCVCVCVIVVIVCDMKLCWKIQCGATQIKEGRRRSYEKELEGEEKQRVVE